MPRPNVREQRRADLTLAFAKVLAEHGFARATIARVATEADVAPGLVHHHFESKDDLLVSLLEMLLTEFRQRVRRFEGKEQGLDAYVMAALALEDGADNVAARCWVGVLGEALRYPALFARVRRGVDDELSAIVKRSKGKLSAHDSTAVLAFIFGALVLGAFAPKKTAGFAAPAGRTFLRALSSGSRV